MRHLFLMWSQRRWKWFADANSEIEQPISRKLIDSEAAIKWSSKVKCKSKCSPVHHRSYSVVKYNTFHVFKFTFMFFTFHFTFEYVAIS